MVSGRPWGAVIVSSGADETLADDVERRLAPFAALLALAVASAEAREQVIASRARLVAASDEVRRRLERDLHHGARAAARHTRPQHWRRPPEGRRRGARRAAAAAERERGRRSPSFATWRPASIHRFSRRAGSRRRLRARAPDAAEVELVVVPDERFDPTVEVAAYFVVTEALTNVVKHAEATVVRVSARRERTSPGVEYRGRRPRRRQSAGRVGPGRAHRPGRGAARDAQHLELLDGRNAPARRVPLGG